MFPCCSTSTELLYFNSGCIFFVNLFDTGRASRLLQLPSFSLAFLLKVRDWLLRSVKTLIHPLIHPVLTSIPFARTPSQHYAGYQADKKHQLSDWRQRPLPDAMLSYARSDTHFLLDIYDRLREDLCSANNAVNASDNIVSIETVLEDSRAVCLRR